MAEETKGDEEIARLKTVPGIGPVIHARKKGGNQGVYSPLSKGFEKKEKDSVDEFTRLTGYHRKSAIRLLGAKPVTQVMRYFDGKPVKIKPEKKRPSSRKGKRIYTDEVISALRLV
jgi:hypothetical protein